MKLLLLLVLVVLLVNGTHCRRITRPKRSVHDVFGYVSNKVSQVKNYIILKKEDVKHKAKDAMLSVKSLYTRGKKSLSNLTNDKISKLKRINEKLQSYIEKAQGTAKTIFDVIAPGEMKFECTDNDPSKDMTALELITVHGYHAESHAVITKDGYILTLHRIPYSKNTTIPTGKTVLLHHGFLGSSIDWVIPGPENSLPYLLSEAGYDVWMANARGNSYSQGHTHRTIDSAAYWNFTFQDIAQYDLPAVIDYIQVNKNGNRKIDYVGYSMGTTVLFALLSTETKYNDVLRAGYTLAPVAYMTSLKSPFKMIAQHGKTIEGFFKLVGANQFLPHNAVARYLSKHSCKIEDIQGAICEISMYLLCGHDENHFDRSLMPMILGHVPAGSSTKTLAHFGQEITNDGKFQKFDYGVKGNIREYGTPTPPEYPLNKISLPIMMISANDDWLSSLTDATKMYQQLMNPIEHYIVPDKEFNHLDFLFAKDAKILVYDTLLSAMEKPPKQPGFERNEIA